MKEIESNYFEEEQDPTEMLLNLSTKETKTVRMNLLFTPTMAKKIKIFAEKENRSVNSCVEIAVMEMFEKYGY